MHSVVHFDVCVHTAAESAAQPSALSRCRRSTRVSRVPSRNRGLRIVTGCQ